MRVPDGRLSVICGMLMLTAMGCNKAQVTSPLADSGASYVPAATWRTADLAAAGFDASRMSTLSANVSGGRYGTIDGLVIQSLLE